MKYLFTFFIALNLFSCSKFEEVDFQAIKCQQAPTAEISIVDLKNLRYSFSLTNVGTTTETELLKVIWTIDGKTISASKVSHQFDKKGSQVITAKLYNKCLMETVLSKNLNVQ